MQQFPSRKCSIRVAETFIKKKKKSTKSRKFLLAKVSAKTCLNVNVTVAIGFHCCFDVMTLLLSKQNTEITKANVMSSFI